MNRLFPLFFAVIFFAGCDSEIRPEGVISRNEMISLLTDVHLIDGYVFSSRDDSVKISQAQLYRSVFAKYKIDSVKFAENMQYYSRNPEKFELMYKEIRKNLEKQQAYLKKIQKEEKKK